MATIFDADPRELILKVAEELKKINDIKAPDWAIYVKTGAHKERPPADKDWWYIRAAAVLRNVSKLGPIGVEKLRTKYGGKKNKGHKSEHFYKGSGNIARKILQQLEKAELVKQDAHGPHKGRVTTAKGQSMLDKIATEILKASNKFQKEEVKKLTPQVPKKPVAETPKKEAKKPAVESPKKEEAKKPTGEEK